MENEMSPFTRTLLHGLAVSCRNLMEYKAALGRTMIIGQEDGSWRELPAVEKLQEAKNASWWKECF